ncbi:MAG: hypothetical protein ACRENT_06265, partial [Thermodesulfobacteriota bacterium]
QSAGEPQGANRYNYTRNNPPNRSDPLGLDEVFPTHWPQKLLSIMVSSASFFQNTAVGAVVTWASKS